MKQAVDKYAGKIGRESGAPYEAFVRAALAPLTLHHGDLLAGQLTARHATECLEAFANKKMATRRSYYKALQRFSRHLNQRGTCLRDFAADAARRMERQDEPLPWKTKKGAQQVGRGKVQLRGMAEVYAYTEAALKLDYPKSHYGKDTTGPRARLERVVAALLLPWTGLRSGEVLHVRKCDLDLQAGIGRLGALDGDVHDDGWDVKTASSAGKFVIPEVVLPHLRALLDLTGPDEYLFRDVMDAGQPRTRWWLRDLVKEVCEAARVHEEPGDEGTPIRVVTPHGLRGTWGTMTMEERQAAVAAASKGLRHGDSATGAATFKRHYQGAPELRPALRLVVGGKAEGVEGEGDA